MQKVACSEDGANQCGRQVTNNEQFKAYVKQNSALDSLEYF